MFAAAPILMREILMVRRLRNAPGVVVSRAQLKSRPRLLGEKFA